MPDSEAVPHQLPLVLIVSVRPLYVTALVLPKLLLTATLVEIVPAACDDEKKMSSLPFPEKKFCVMTLFCAPRSAPLLTKLVRARPDSVLFENVLPLTSTC